MLSLEGLPALGVKMMMNFRTRPTAIPTGSRLSQQMSAFGLVVWVLAIVMIQLELAEAILLFAPLVLLPLGVDILAAISQSGNNIRLLQVARWVQLPAALVLVGSFSQPIGPFSGLLAVPWFLVTVFYSAFGLLRILQKEGLASGQFCINAGLFYLAVGGTATLMYRYGLRVLNFPEGIILLTGVHFHYAGFILPLVAGLIVRETSSRWMYCLSTVIVISIPVVGVGITFSPLIEVIAALILATTCLLLAAIQIRIAVKTNDWTTRSLLVISSVSLIFSMVLASVYAVGEYLQTRWLTIPLMIPSHGIANAFGFALCGLWGWRKMLK